MFIKHALCVSYPPVNLHILATFPSAGIDNPMKRCQEQQKLQKISSIQIIFDIHKGKCMGSPLKVNTSVNARNPISFILKKMELVDSFCCITAGRKSEAVSFHTLPICADTDIFHYVPSALKYKIHNRSCLIYCTCICAYPKRKPEHVNIQL